MTNKKSGNRTFSLVNGAVADSIPLGDRGLSFGDSVFTTMKVLSGKIELLEAHLLRLIRDSQALHFPSMSSELIRADLRALPIEEMDSGTIRFTLTRGSGPRGYKIPDQAEPRRIAQWFPGSASKPPESGINLRVCTTRLSSQPLTAGLKHGNRLEQVLARSEWDDREVFEGLMLDQGNRIIEGTCSNFFIIDKQRLITPKLMDCGVKGVMRDLVIKVAQALGFAVEQADLTLDSLATMNSGFICNALIGIVPVVRLEKKDWVRSPLFTTLQTHIRDELQKSLMRP